MQRAVQVPDGLLVHRNPIGPCFGKCRNEFVGILDHQMTIERRLGNLPQRLHYRRTEGEIGDEMSIHNVDMDDAGATFLGGAYLLAETGEVRRKNRRCKLNQTESLKPGLSDGLALWVLCQILACAGPWTPVVMGVSG